VNATWQVQEAKSRFSKMIEDACHQGAQTITRHGRPVAVLISAEEYAQLRPVRKIVDVLRECPSPGLEITRLPDKPRPLPL
jgi:antitoxin Phd